MRRTNVYLEDAQLDALAAVSKNRGEPVAALIRQAVDSWLQEHGVSVIPPDEWERRFGALLERRSQIAAPAAASLEEVERDVAAAVAEVRAARRR
jgi:hypothetical protein